MRLKGWNVCDSIVLLAYLPFQLHWHFHTFITHQPLISHAQSTRYASVASGMLFNDAEIQSTRHKKSDPDYVDVVVGLIDSRSLWEDGVCSKVRNEIYGTEYASTLLLLGIGSIVLQIAINMLLSALSAIIPEQVPLRQRATVSAFGGMAPLFGGLIGQVIVAQVVKDITSSFLILAQVCACILIVFSLVLREDPLSKEVATPFHLKDVPKTFWLNPRTYLDFALTWIARCCIFLASTTVVNYMYYFLQEDIHYTHTTGQPVAQGVQQFSFPC